MALSARPPNLRNPGLFVLLAGQLLPMIDFSIVNVALSAISTSLHASQAQLEMVVACYGVAFAVCLASAGRLGDRFGRRRLFTFGVVLFGLSSLLCGMAPSILWLLLARAAQGIAAALIAPQVLATIHVTLRGRRHALALGLYGAIGGLAFIVGQVLGGWLISADLAGQGWRSVFLINIPICIGILPFLYRVVPETTRENAAGLDLPGTALFALVVAFLLVPMALGPSQRWPAWCLALLGAVLPLGAALLLVERRQERLGRFPLLSPALLGVPGMRFGFVIALLFFSGWSGFMFTMAVMLQSGAGFTPLQSGNAFIALGAAYFLGSLLSRRVVERLRAVPTLLAGLAVQIVGLLGLMAALEAVWPHPTLVNLAPATALIGFGQAFIVNCFFRIGLSDVPRDQAGAGSAMLATMQQTSFGLGAALLGGVFGVALQATGTYRSAILVTLATESGLMLALAATALHQLRRRREAA
jgi:MFS family permease